MSERTFDRETLLDLTVNIIPLGIIAFFFALFMLVRYWDADPLITLVSFGLLVVPFVGLALLTFISGRVIARDEESDTHAPALDDADESTIESGADDN